MTRSRCVCYGTNNLLLEIRQLILMHAGYCMEKAMSLVELDRMVEQERVDLLILCHSLPEEECGRAVALVQARWPEVKVLTLSATNLPAQGLRNGRGMLPANGASALVETVQKILDAPQPV
jgi:hypothetical protein